MNYTAGTIFSIAMLFLVPLQQQGYGTFHLNSTDSYREPGFIKGSNNMVVEGNLYTLFFPVHYLKDVEPKGKIIFSFFWGDNDTLKVYGFYGKEDSGTNFEAKRIETFANEKYTLQYKNGNVFGNLRMLRKEAKDIWKYLNTDTEGKKIDYILLIPAIDSSSLNITYSIAYCDGDPKTCTPIISSQKAAPSVTLNPSPPKSYN